MTVLWQIWLNGVHLLVLVCSAMGSTWTIPHTGTNTGNTRLELTAVTAQKVCAKTRAHAQA